MFAADLSLPHPMHRLLQGEVIRIGRIRHEDRPVTSGREAFQQLLHLREVKKCVGEIGGLFLRVGGEKAVDMS